MNIVLTWLKKPAVYVSLIILLLVGWGIAVLNRPEEPNIVTVFAERTDIEQIVSVTGSVKAASSANLAFEKSGRVNHIYIKVGSLVRAGEVLVTLNNTDLVAQLNQANASTKAAEAKLEQLKAGGSPESIAVAKVELQNAKDTLRDAKKTAFDTFNETITTIDNAIRNNADGFFSNPESSSLDFNLTVTSSLETTLENQRIGMQTVLNENAIILFDETADFSTLLSKAKDNLNQVKMFLDNLASAVNTLVANAGLSQTTIDAYKLTVSTARSNIDTQTAAVTTDEKSIRSAWATVTLEESQLILAESPARPEEIKAQEAAVEQAEANSANILAQLSKTVLRSPISGVVTQKEIEIGEIASPNSIVVSVISADKFEIEADISEADIAKVQLDNTAEITLDAFTEDQKWTGKVIRINPAEKIISGVVYYETAITFNKLDPKIASGMTANVDILTASKENVLSVPQRAVIQKNGNKIIRVLVNGEVKEQEVQIGLRGSDGEIEVISGLKEGDEVITFIEKSD